MIQSHGSMPSGNFDEPVTSPPQQPSAQTRFRFPADYYSAPLSEVKPVLPKWVPWGCGTAAAIFVIGLLIIGSLMTGSRLAALVDLTLGMSMGEVKAAYASDVTDVQKAAFDQEVDAMRKNLREGTISTADIQPFLKTMQKAIKDEKVTGAEVEALTSAARAASRSKAPS